MNTENKIHEDEVSEETLKDNIETIRKQQVFMFGVLLAVIFITFNLGNIADDTVRFALTAGTVLHHLIFVIVFVKLRTKKNLYRYLLMKMYKQ